MKQATYLFVTTLLFATLFASSAKAQTKVNGKTCVGTWKTVDDETGRTKSHVRIYKKGSDYHAEIVRLLDEQSLKASGEKNFADIKCTKCPSDHGKGQTMHGLEIIWGMEDDGSKWSGGQIMDPKKGKVYTCTMWMDDGDSSGNTLKVRGWVGFLFRTQTWYRVN